MARQMAVADFRTEQWDRRYDAHVARINSLVDDLRENTDCGGAPPYVAPMYGGINAKILYVLRDPGPMTDDCNRGSGFICMENDDATAETICGLFEEAGIEAADIVPWNAYPW